MSGNHYKSDIACPVCNSSDSKVIESRGNKDASAVWRRRQCQTCGKRYSTSEMIGVSAQRLAERLNMLRAEMTTLQAMLATHRSQPHE
jgi:transcriptional regulator NrdR family protein